jgi:hypothetical protein
MHAYWFVVLGEERASNYQGKRLLAGPVLALNPAKFCCQTTCCDVPCFFLDDGSSLSAMFLGEKMDSNVGQN